MSHVLDVINQETRWLRVSREELVSQLRRARRMARVRWGTGRAQWQSLMADANYTLDRSAEPVFDAALAMADFAYDVRRSLQRVWRKL